MYQELHNKKPGMSRACMSPRCGLGGLGLAEELLQRGGSVSPHGCRPGSPLGIGHLQRPCFDGCEEPFEGQAQEGRFRLRPEFCLHVPAVRNDFLDRAAGGHAVAIARLEGETDVDRMAVEGVDGRVPGVEGDGACHDLVTEVVSGELAHLRRELEGRSGRLGHAVEKEEGRLVIAGADLSHVFLAIVDDGVAFDRHLFFTAEHEQLT